MRQTLGKWVESLGGPLVMMGASNLGAWRGSEGRGEVDGSDYERACAIDEYLGVLEVGGGEALVLGDRPLPTAWLPTAEGGLIIRWDYAEENPQVAVFDSVISRASSEDELVITLTDTRIVLFDSVWPGNEIRDSLEFELAPGVFSVGTIEFDPSENSRFLVHRLRAR